MMRAAFDTVAVRGRTSPAPVAAPPAGEAPSTTGRVLWWGILLLAAIYVALFAAGLRFFVLKTAVLPLFLLYALALRERARFVADWLPVLSATLLFDALRGAIFVAIQQGVHGYHVDYVIALERAVIGVPAAPLALQALRAPLVDAVAVAIHASHFAYFLLFGLVLWHLRRDCFPLYSRALLLVMLLGAIGYALVPTAPPWLAAAEGALPPLAHVVTAVYSLMLPDLYRAFDTNPVAAMPSLHSAFPVMCALVGWRAYGAAAGALLAGYAALVGIVVMYLGEHYAVDVLAGVAVAGLAVWLVRDRGGPRSPRRALALSGAGLAMTVVVVVFVR